MRAKHDSAPLLHEPQPGLEPETRACTLTGNPRDNILVHGTMLSRHLGGLCGRPQVQKNTSKNPTLQTLENFKTMKKKVRNKAAQFTKLHDYEIMVQGTKP